jgi:Ca-activated chloride channel family protein
MKFGNVSYLFLLWLVPALIIFYIYAFRKKDALIAEFCRIELLQALMPSVSRRRQLFKAALLIVAIFFCLIALMQPRWGFQWEEIKRYGVDIVIALDLSESMRAEDVKPNRLERAKREVFDLLQMVDGDRIGLVAFGGTSFLHCPLTLDYGAVQIFLDNLDTDLIPVPGTAMAEALRTSTAAFSRTERKSKAIILITDGEDHAGDVLKAAEEAKKEGIRIFAIGIGGEGGSPIPEKDGKGGFLKDGEGNVVHSKLDEVTLQKIALSTGGAYVRSVTGDLDLEKIYKEEIHKMEGKELKSTRRKRWEERFQWFIFMALLALVAEPFVSERKRVMKAGPNLLVLAVLLLMVLPTGAQADANKNAIADITQKGAREYEQQAYDKALSTFLDGQTNEAPESIELKYNIAASQYKLNQHDKAIEGFLDVASRPNADASLQSKCYYNIGNSYFRQGKFQESVAAYEKAQELNPQDEDTKYNLNIVKEMYKRWLNEQKKREEEEKKKQEQNKDQKQDQSKDKEKKECPNPKPGQSGDQKKDEQKKEQPKDQAGQQKEQQQQEQQQQQQAAADDKNKDDKDKKDGAEQQAAQAVQLTPEQAEQLLNSLKEDQKEMLKKQLIQKYGDAPRAEKYW